MTQQHREWLDFGVSQPLTLGMANHPLADRLETLASTKVRKTASRPAMAALLLGGMLVSAPLSIAEDGPQDELPETVVSIDKKDRSKSVIKVTKKDKEGNNVRKHYEVEVNAGEVEAYEIDLFGRRTKIETNDIKGFDADVMENSKSWAFVVDDNVELAFDPNGAPKPPTAPASHGAMPHKQHRIIRMKRDQQDLIEFGEMESMREQLKASGLSEDRIIVIEKEIEDALDRAKIEGGPQSKKMRTFMWTGDAPEPPMPPNAMMLEGGGVDVETFVLKGSEVGGGDSRVVIKRKGLNGNVISFDHDETHHLQAGTYRLDAAQSMIDSVEDMLSDVDGLEGDDKALRDAKRDLEKARKSLRKASEKIAKSKEAAIKDK